jgi:hypothetical protein
MPRLIRRLASRMVRCATRDDRSPDRAFIARQLDSIDGDARALIWSIGFAWAVRAERAIGSIKPATSCLLLFPALYCATHFLVGRLVWYGVPASAQGWSNDARGLLRLALCIGLLALVGFMAPGRLRRRVVVVCAFPLLGLTSLCSAGWGADLMTAVGLPDHLALAQVLIRGIGFGIAMTALLALPALLLYREMAAPVVILALVPAIARTHWTANAYFRHSESLAELFWLACPFICAAIGVVVAIATCRRWLCCVPLQKRPAPPRRSAL